MAHWDEKHVAYLLELWGAGNSASKCAEKVNQRFRTNYTRSAALGKIHRLGKSGQPPRCKANPKPRKTPRCRPVSSLPPEDSVRPALPPQSEPGPEEDAELIGSAEIVTVANAQNFHCRWPIGEPGRPDFRFCGNPRCDPGPLEAGNPYCEAHAKYRVARSTTWSAEKRAQHGRRVREAKALKQRERELQDI